MAQKPHTTSNPSRTLLLLSLTLVALAMIGAITGSQPVAAKQTARPAATVKKTTATQAHPKPATPVATPAVSTPTPTAVATPTPKPTAVAAKPAVVHSAKPAPVVTTAPGSSVSGLAPVAPTTTPSTPSGGSSGSGTGTSTPTPPPATTTSYTSTNWSGYLATTDTYTGISGSWTATNPIGNSTSTSADSTWIGIGGVSSSDLIQVGTQNIVSASGHVTASAFYELLPASSQTVPGLTVAPGDSMTATITQVSSGQWTITITDTTNSQTWTTTLAYTSTNSSAEWIEEDPSYSSGRQIPFDNYQTTSFTDGSATTASGNASIATLNGQPITMVNHTGQTISAPSNLTSGGAGFSVTRSGS